MQVARDSHQVPLFLIFGSFLAWARIRGSITNQWLLIPSEVFVQGIIWIPIDVAILSDSSCIDFLPRFSWSFLLAPRWVVSGFQGKRVQRMVLLATNDNETYFLQRPPYSCNAEAICQSSFTTHRDWYLPTSHHLWISYHIYLRTFTQVPTLCHLLSDVMVYRHVCHLLHTTTRV